MDRPKEFDEALLEAIPRLKFFAMKLAGSAEGKDLLNSTIVRMLAGWPSFTLGTSMFAWGSCIMHNLHINSFRKKNIEFPMPEDDHGKLLDIGIIESNAENTAYCKEVFLAMQYLSVPHRHILTMRTLGYTYEEMALDMDVEIGTVKSRLNRASEALGRILANA